MATLDEILKLDSLSQVSGPKKSKAVALRVLNVNLFIARNSIKLRRCGRLFRQSCHSQPTRKRSTYSQPVVERAQTGCARPVASHDQFPYFLIGQILHAVTHQIQPQELSKWISSHC